MKKTKDGNRKDGNREDGMTLPAPDELHAWLVARWDGLPVAAERAVICADPYTWSLVLRSYEAHQDGSISLCCDRARPTWRGIPVQVLLPKEVEYDYEVHHLLRWRYRHHPVYAIDDPAVARDAIYRPLADTVIDAPFTHEIYKQGTQERQNEE